MRVRKVTRRREFLRLSVAGAVGTALLAACSQAAPPAPTTTTAPVAQATAAKPATSAEPVTLKFNNRTGKELELFTLMQKAFNEKNPNITIKHESFAGANQEYFQKMAVLISGGTEGDLIWMSSIEGFYDYASRNVWLPVSDLVARDKIDLSQWYKSAVDMMTLDGKMYALPLWSHPSIVGLIYNQDLLDKEGVKMPDELTFDQLTEIAKQLTKRTSDGKAEQLGYNPARGYYNGTGQVILAFGGEMISKDGTKMTYDQPAVKEALQWMGDLHNKHKVVPLPGEADVGQLTINGKLAIWAVGTWGYWSSSQWKFNWGTMMSPKGKSGNHGAMLQTDANTISKRSKNVDAAWEFHKFMCSNEAAMILLDNSYLPGSRPDAWNDPKAKATKGLIPFIQGLDEAVPLPLPANYRTRELEIAINQVMDNLWLGKMSVDQVSAEVNRAGQQVLDKSGGSG